MARRVCRPLEVRPGMERHGVLVSLEVLHNGPSHGIGGLVLGLALAKAFEVVGIGDGTLETVGKLEL